MFTHYYNKSNRNATTALALQILTWLTSSRLVSKRDTPRTPTPKAAIPYRVQCIASTSL